MKHSFKNSFLYDSNVTHRTQKLHLFSRDKRRLQQSGCGRLMVIKPAPLPCDIKELGVYGVNKMWSDARFKSAGIKRVKTLVVAAEYIIGNIKELVATINSD